MRMRSNQDWTAICREAAFVVVAITALVLLYALGNKFDQATAAEAPVRRVSDEQLLDDAAVSARAFEAGRRQGREEMGATVLDAYQQGRRDALMAQAEGVR